MADDLSLREWVVRFAIDTAPNTLDFNTLVRLGVRLDHMHDLNIARSAMLACIDRPVSVKDIADGLRAMADTLEGKT